MKVLFKNVTKYTEENCNRFERFHNKKYGKKELMTLLTITILLIYIAITNMIYKNWWVVCLIILFGILWYFYTQYQSEQGKSGKRKIPSYTFYFYENIIKIKYKKQSDRILYFKLHKIFETKQFFYLYTDEKNSLIIDKNGFQIGTAEEFTKFIKAKCPFKYHREDKHS